MGFKPVGCGFHNSRPAMGVHDDLWARAGSPKRDTTIAFTVVDLIGWFHADIEASRKMLAEQGVDVDHLMVAAITIMKDLTRWGYGVYSNVWGRR